MSKTKEQLIQEAQALGIDTKGLTKTELENAIKALTPPATGTGGGENGGENPGTGTGQGENGDTGATQNPGQDGAGTTAQPGEGVTGAGAAPGTEEEEEEEEEDPGTGDGADAAPQEPREHFELNGSKYRFKKSAPERFNFLSQNKTQQEWLQDEVAMELLISGNSHLIIKIKE